ncbi:MAG TPA: hypothetical protein VGL56_07850 [Fimbriimonadaceae bacterium]
MKGTGIFVIGIAVGVLAVFAVKKARKENSPEDAKLLSKKVAEHLNKLEHRLDTLMHSTEAV